MEIDTYLESVVNKKIPSLNCKIFSFSNDDIYSNSLGYKCLESKDDCDINTNYGIGSITKIFTAISVFQLCEKAIINIEDPIYLYFKQTPFYKTFKSSNIQISHLLSHTSGIANLSFSESRYDKSTYLSGRRIDNNYAMYDYLEDILTFKNRVPGVEFNYLNIGYIILGLIIERVTNSGYKEYINKFIFEALDLNRTYFAGDKELTNLAVPYIYTSGNNYLKGSQLYTEYPQAGGIISNINDLKQLVISLFTKNNSSLINDNSFKLMTTIQKKVNYGSISYDTFVGKGLFINSNFNKMKLYFHNGGIMGGRANISILPEHKIACIVLTNSDNYPAEEISKNLLNLIVNHKRINTIIELESKLKSITGYYYSYKKNTKIRIYKNNNIYILQFCYYPYRLMYTLYTIKYSANIIYFNAINNAVMFQKNKCKILLKSKQLLFNQYLFNKSSD